MAGSMPMSVSPGNSGVGSGSAGTNTLGEGSADAAAASADVAAGGSEDGLAGGDGAATAAAAGGAGTGAADDLLGTRRMLSFTYICTFIFVVYVIFFLKDLIQRCWQRCLQSCGRRLWPLRELVMPRSPDRCSLRPGLLFLLDTSLLIPSMIPTGNGNGCVFGYVASQPEARGLAAACDGG